MLGVAPRDFEGATPHLRSQPLKWMPQNGRPQRHWGGVPGCRSVSVRMAGSRAGRACRGDSRRVLLRIRGKTLQGPHQNPPQSRPGHAGPGDTPPGNHDRSNDPPPPGLHLPAGSAELRPPRLAPSHSGARGTTVPQTARETRSVYGTGLVRFGWCAGLGRRRTRPLSAAGSSGTELEDADGGGIRGQDARADEGRCRHFVTEPV
jgi:hypothetical protein